MHCSCGGAHPGTGRSTIQVLENKELWDAEPGPSAWVGSLGSPIGGRFSQTGFGERVLAWRGPLENLGPQSGKVQEMAPGHQATWEVKVG